MPSIPISQSVFVGAAVLGVVSAAAVYVFESFRQEKRRHAMAKDLARLDVELSVLRTELDKLLIQQKDKNKKTRRTRRSNKANSIITTTTEDFMSMGDMDSSDLEFYDVSDEEEVDSIISNSLEVALKEIDRYLENKTHLEECLDKLTDLCMGHPGDPELLWRIGKCHYKISENLEVKEKLVQIEKGIEACAAAIKLSPNLAEAHKWIAILFGSRSDFQSTKQKIIDGQLFKKHVDLAIALSPNDAVLHHLVGRFCYEIAGLKWYERTAAAALYAEPPSSTYEEALQHFLEADRLADYSWRENYISLAKCHFTLGNHKEGFVWLDKAKIKQGDTLDYKIDEDIKSLAEKYSSYR